MTRFESYMLGFGTALILLWCGQAWADDMDRYPPPGPDGRVSRADRSGATVNPEPWVSMQSTRERLIREWAASGEICRVLGHRWENGPIPYHVEFRQIGNDWIVDKSYPELGRNQRRCPICGKVETKEEVWR